MTRKLHLIFILIFTLVTVHATSQDKKNFISLMSDEETFLFRNVLLLELRDSSVFIQNAYKYDVGKIKFLGPGAEVDIVDIDLIKVGNIPKNGFITGAAIGLGVGMITGVVWCEGNNCNEPGCVVLKPASCASVIVGSALIGVLGGGLIGLIRQSAAREPLVIEINKNHKKYMNNKDYLENFAFGH